MIRHLESKLVISNFVYIVAHGIFQVSSWKTFFVFRLSKFNEDEVRGVLLRGSAGLISDYLPFIFSNLGSAISSL